MPRYSNPIWLDVEWNKTRKIFTYKNNNLTVLDTTFMKDETIPSDESKQFGAINLRYEKPIIHALSNKKESDIALTVCRKDAVTTPGIKALNLMLDPAKRTERNETIEATKDDWNKKFGNLNFVKAYEKLFELLWYSRLPCFDVRNVTSYERDEMSVIKRCYWRSQLVDCASIFVTRSTDRGMCCAFNMVNANEIYKNLDYRIATEKMQKITKADSFPAG